MRRRPSKLAHTHKRTTTACLLYYFTILSCPVTHHTQYSATVLYIKSYSATVRLFTSESKRPSSTLYCAAHFLSTPNAFKGEKMIVYTLVCMFDTTQHSAQHTPPHTTHHTAHITHHPPHNTQHCIQHDIQHNSATAQHHTPHNTPDEVLSLLPTLITGSGICAARPPIGKFCDKSEGEGEEGGRGVEESEKGKAGRTGGTGMGRRAGRGRREKGVSGGTEQREDLGTTHTHTTARHSTHTHTHGRDDPPATPLLLTCKLRCVCAPQSTSLSTSMGPNASDSDRVAIPRLSPEAMRALLAMPPPPYLDAAAAAFVQ